MEADFSKPMLEFRPVRQKNFIFFPKWKSPRQRKNEITHERGWS